MVSSDTKLERRRQEAETSGMSIDIDSTARAKGVRDAEETSTMKTVVVTKAAAEVPGAQENRT